MKKSILILIITFFIYQNIFAQGVGIGNLPPHEAVKYVKPLATYLGTFFNTGTYHNADVPDLFGFKFSIVGTYTIIPQSDKSFKPNPGLEGSENFQSTATIFGTQGGYFLSNSGFIIYPSGLGLKYIPLGIYQAAGSLLGTELMLRYYPTIKKENIQAGLWGIGIKHEISRYFPLLPLDISVQILYNKLNIESTSSDSSAYVKFDTKNFAFNIHASKTFAGLVVFYGGLQYESSTLDIGYYFEDPDGVFPSLVDGVYNLKIDGDNHFRLTVGTALQLSFFVLNFDANITRQTTLSAGISFEF
ncbi:MAG: DUF6588 family protein [Ignavibacterium sp.]|uniref:DUF6588 family protein n=1 Tax=Ignavibacterium sp. TaxID=2651167 RepID=UPI004049D512